MKALIENYRGWDIYFDTHDESFSAIVEAEDRQQTKKSYAAIKKAIDEHIKANGAFKPFTVERVPTHSDSVPQRLLVTSIRKDGRFMVQNEKGQVSQISDFRWEKYTRVDHDNSEFWQGQAERNEQMNLLVHQMRLALQTYQPGKPLEEIKDELSF